MQTNGADAHNGGGRWQGPGFHGAQAGSLGGVPAGPDFAAMKLLADRLDRVCEVKWWEVLEVDRDAPDATIRKAYFRLANIHHPDKGGDALMFDQVQKAYDLATGKRGV